MTQTSTQSIETAPRAAREAYWRNATQLLERAPEFEMHDLGGRVYRLSDFRNESVVVLEFGAIT